MDVRQTEQTVIAKPIASRPTSSGFGSFSELLSGAIDESPPRTNERSETNVWAVRPMTVRPAIIQSSQGETSGTDPSSSSGKVGSTGKQSIVVFRPLAKVVSKATVSLLASMRHFDNTSQQAPNQVDDRGNDRLISTQSLCNLPQVEQSQPIKPSRITASSSCNVDQISSDGYNWRKYGQKQVKGSEYPRSYYKCTQPNCTVKKKVERSFDGEVAEIVYKGEHNHPKPTLNKRNINDNVPELDGEPDIRFSAEKSAMLLDYSNVSDGLNEDPKSKRRKHGNRKNDTETCNSRMEETQILVRNKAEPEIMGDGFRWRKYGQKVVNGNPYPRSYYRCTNLKCKVRKHVERALDDPSAFITTYEGKHNHERQ